MFFPIVAAVSFRVLPDTRSAGLVVRNCLGLLNVEGLMAGSLLIPLLFVSGWTSVYGRNVIGPVSCTAVMLTLTAFSQWNIIPRMEADQRAVGGNIGSVAQNNPHRAEFDRLHTASTRVHGGVLVAGIAAVIFLARPSSRSVRR